MEVSMPGHSAAETILQLQRLLFANRQPMSITMFADPGTADPRSTIHGFTSEGGCFAVPGQLHSRYDCLHPPSWTEFNNYLSRIRKGG